MSPLNGRNFLRLKMKVNDFLSNGVKHVQCVFYENLNVVVFYEISRLQTLNFKNLLTLKGLRASRVCNGLNFIFIYYSL